MKLITLKVFLRPIRLRGVLAEYSSGAGTAAAVRPWPIDALCQSRNEARFEPRSELLGGLLRVLATFAGPLHRHDADERQRYDALPAERAADLNGGGENFR